MSRIVVLPHLDSEEMASQRRRELDIDRGVAAALGHSALEAIRDGMYANNRSQRVLWRDAVQAASARKVSIPPDADLPIRDAAPFDETRIQVTNETTLAASRRLHNGGMRPLALNFANGVHPGGGFLSGARAQEEVLCRSSALYQTLIDDPMYDAHRRRVQPDSTGWAILSPDVPVFRNDDGTSLENHWPLSVITCAAPVAPAIGQPRAGDLLQERILRVLAIARAHEYSTLVLGAWGCGAFGNDPQRTAKNFRRAIEHDYAGEFSHVVFAITDWSRERRYLGPFKSVFAETAGDSL